MKRLLLALVIGAAMQSSAQAAPCITVTLTGTQSGPAVFRGTAGAGTLVRYGDDANNCDALRLQFDAGRGTNMRLSQVGVEIGHIDAIFFTHMHNDHTEGFADILQVRWSYEPNGPKLDVVCSADAKSPAGHVISCKNFSAHIGDPFLHSGEIAQRALEDKNRQLEGPAAITNVITFEPTNEPKVVWTSGDVKVSAIRSTHIPGHASYRVDTPAGSVVIGGDAGNDKMAPPRDHSTSDQVELLAKGVDIIVHSTMHPVMGPPHGSTIPPPIFYRQSATNDLGAMAKRVGAKILMLTHLGPSIGAAKQGPYTIPGGPLTEASFRQAAEEGGFTGQIVVGTDLASVRLPAK